MVAAISAHLGELVGQHRVGDQLLGHPPPRRRAERVSHLVDPGERAALVAAGARRPHEGDPSVVDRGGVLEKRTRRLLGWITFRRVSARLGIASNASAPRSVRCQSSRAPGARVPAASPADRRRPSLLLTHCREVPGTCSSRTCRVKSNRCWPRLSRIAAAVRSGSITNRLVMIG